MQYLLLLLFWSVFFVLHSFFASLSFKNWLHQVIGKSYALYRLLYNVVSLTIFIFISNWSHGVISPAVVTWPNSFKFVQYGILFLASLVFVASFFSQDVWEFLGLRQIVNINQSYADTTTFSRQGLLKWTRHPMYSATLVILWCTDMNVVGLVTRLTFTMYLIVGSYLEEQKLVAEFGETYRQYQKEVPMFIPRLRLSRNSQ